MTDNEIIKDCKSCLHYEACKGTYYSAKGDEDILHEFEGEMYGHSGCENFEDKDLINRQKAELERLNNLKRFEKFIDERIHTDKVRGLSWEFETKEARDKAFEKELEKLFDITTARAEAVKDFAEVVKIKTLAMVHSPGILTTADYIKCIDDIVKEWVGENNDRQRKVN